MWQNLERLWWEQPKEIASEVQGNYPKFKQNIAEKKVLVIWKLSEIQMMFGKLRLREAKFKTLTTRVFSEEYESEI